ncbi:MAG: PVC-type heme-binding CxxCH protein [Gemmataceae bacterium]
MYRLTISLGLLTVVCWLGWAAPEEKQRGPRSPAEEKAAIQLDPGLKLELVATEPQVESPVALAFDEAGRLFVAEMLDYPNGPPKGQPPESRIKLLEDADGDGVYEKATIFAEQVSFANGLMPWQGGLIVTAAPHILFLKDTDGDGKADRRHILFTGFAEENPQLRVNHPMLGLDNWIYVSNGLRGGSIKKGSGEGQPAISISGMDFRFDPIGGRYEAISGPGQFGHCFDDWGRRFVCDNRHHLRHVVLPNHALKRNAFLAVPGVLEDTTQLGTDKQGGGAPVYPLSKNWTTSNLHAGQFTAACGVFVYRGDLLPESYRGAAFTCDPTGNLIHQEVLKPHGATFRSKPPRDKVEFFATPDDWCRPVYLELGPDGALYVADMYRAVIEHPQFMPQELKNRPDLLLGKDKGRIWRIVPDKYTPKAMRPGLDKAATEKLVELLGHPNAWWRTTAQRLIWERQDKEAIPPLKQALAAQAPLARVHAGWLLAGFNALDDGALTTLLDDKDPRVRENAVCIAADSREAKPRLPDRLIALADDSDAQVRFQVALALGGWNDERVVPALAKIALADAADPWARRAVASSVPERAGALLARLLEEKKQPAGYNALVEELSALVGARRDPQEVAGVLAALQKLPGDQLGRQLAILVGIADGMGRRGTQLTAFLDKLPAKDRPLAEGVKKLFKETAQVAGDSKKPPGERLAALNLLAHAAWDVASPVLTKLVQEEPLQDIRLAAVAALAAQPDAKVSELLMDDWRSYTPALRRGVTEAMMRTPARIEYFLKQIEAGSVKPGDLDPLRMRQLVNHRDTKIRELAGKLLKQSLPADRKKVLEEYQAALKMKGDAARGKQVFQKNCAACHKIADVGVNVAPDISDTRTKTYEMLLVDVLSPNQAIDNNFVNYLVTTKNGKVLTGIITAETAASITLVRAENQRDVVLRQDIDEIVSSGASLMPEGLEKNITVADMADLLSFLKNWRYLDGAVPMK